MVSLIPGLAKTLAYWRPQEATPPAENFSQVLAAVSSGTRQAGAAAATYQVQPGDNLSRIAKKLGYENPLALARANGLKDPNLLKPGQVLILPEQAGAGAAGAAPKAAPGQPVQTARPKKAAVSGGPLLVKASWYGPRHHGRLMANGQPFDMFADTAAHRDLPLGTRLKVTNPKNGRSVEVAVTDRGPFIPGRSLDLSLGAARKLGVVEAGVSRLYIEHQSG